MEGPKNYFPKIQVFEILKKILKNKTFRFLKIIFFEKTYVFLSSENYILQKFTFVEKPQNLGPKNLFEKKSMFEAVYKKLKKKIIMFSSPLKNI